LLERALRETVTDPTVALDRLNALDRLRLLVDGLERQAVLGARRAGCTWLEMGAALGVTRRRAVSRWRPQVRRWEAAGLIGPDPLPPPAPPVDAAAAADLRDVRVWCRWCGHRLVQAGADGGWRHNSTDGPAGEFLDVDCPGPAPWPAEED
jgi:ribosomal protein S27E